MQHKYYSLWRWLECGSTHCGVSLVGAYLVVANNLELAYMQGAHSAHVVCVVDDFGNLVRKPNV